MNIKNENINIKVLTVKIAMASLSTSREIKTQRSRDWILHISRDTTEPQTSQCS
jgi:hypothetical protein